MLSLVEEAQRLLNLLLDGRRLKRLFEGWLVSPTKLAAMWVSQVLYVSREEGEWGADNLFSSLYVLESLSFVSCAASEPHSDAAATFNNESDHNGCWSSCSPQFVEEVWCGWTFWANAAELVVQERSSEICTPRYLVLLTLTAVESLVFRGGCLIF